MPHPFLEGFSEFGDLEGVDVTRRNLPHWEYPGATYFITMRLDDSIPASVLSAWEEDRALWLREHGAAPGALSSLSESDREEYREHFTQRWQDYLDRGAGQCHLRRPDCQEIVSNAIRKFDGMRFDLGDFVIMPNHLHFLFRPKSSFHLKKLCWGLKNYTSRLCNEAIGRSGPFWQSESFDRIVRDPAELRAYRGYIHANPEMAKLRDGESVLYSIGELD